MQERKGEDHLRWKEISREVAWRDPYGRVIEKVAYQLPDGRQADYFLRRVKDTVVVLALTQDQKVILAKQYRPGKDCVLYELPGGGIEVEQSPEDAVRAELLEETGYTGTFQLVCVSLRDGYSNWRSHCFVATNCTKASEQRLDTNEFIEVVLMPLNEVRALARSGQMTDIDAAMLGLDYLGLLSST